MAIQHLRTRDPRWDMRSYVAIHMSLIFGVGMLITGSIWAKGAWGHWWVWSEPTLVSFLIIFLLYATYQPLRFAIEDPERQARSPSVFAITAGVFVPINFIAVRLSTAYLHPRMLGNITQPARPDGAQLLVSLVAITLLFVTLCKYEMAAKHARAQLRALRRRLTGEEETPPAAQRRPLAEPLRRALLGGRVRASAAGRLRRRVPALPLHTAGKYVAGAYIVLFALVLIYVAIMATASAASSASWASCWSSPSARPRRRAEPVGTRRRPGRPRRSIPSMRSPRAMSELLALGISHKTAPVALRERLAFTEPRGGAARAGG